MRIAYLTSNYALVSHSFIRSEVFALREQGHEILTFSVRRPPAEELIGDEIKSEYEATEHLLAAGPFSLGWQLIRWALRCPARVARCLRLAVRIGNPGLRGRLLPGAYLLEAALLARRLVDLDVEHLHDHFAEGSASVALFASALSGVPFSFTVHGPEEFDRAATLALNVKAAASRFVVAITEFARSQIYRWIDPPDWGKVHVVHCGVGPSFLGPIVSPPVGNRLVTIGRLVEQKGQLVLIDALAEARRDGVDLELIVIGDGPLRDLVEKRIEDLGLTGAVRMCGWLDGGDVLEQIEASRAVVLPSFAEGLPIVLMEAMARGRPVVATRVGGIAELVEPAVNGWLVAPGSIQQLADALRELAATDVERLAQMGREGAAAVAREHDRTREARKLALLMQVEAGPSSAAG